jgi:uncharacterized protein YukE
MAEGSVHLDPKEVREFAQQLRGASRYYETVIDRLEANLGRLGKSWRDQQFGEFVDEVATLKTGLRKYIREAEAASAHLGELAEAAEHYARVHLR